MSLDDFDRVKLIGRGAYGEVQLVRAFPSVNECVGARLEISWTLTV